jgi:hypothetical protein
MKGNSMVSLQKIVIVLKYSARHVMIKNLNNGLGDIEFGKLHSIFSKQNFTLS